MKAPPSEARAGETAEQPEFERLESPAEVVAGERTRDDYLSVALQLREPTSVAEIAERADRGADSAREYMRWFETIGLVHKASEEPEQYETNQSYLYWRRVERIRNEYSEREIVERLQSVAEELDAFLDRYEASRPDDIGIGSTARTRDVAVEAVWDDVTRWKTVLARRNLLEDALDSDRDHYRWEDESDASTSTRPA